ncbi:MAG: hemerythrin domain-containing protein [Candidatus Eremiobacteraeota bacterium]|nr:hemerythrin domain-containing protein [Candidatus Eremiobacteraeota bacterium]
MPDVLTLLKKDHDKVKQLFEEVNDLSDGAHATRRKLFEQIDEELSLHAKLEETIFYPKFKTKTKAASDERDEILEAYEEHASVKDLLRKLESTDPSDETYKAKLQVLSELVDHHVKEEENEMFKQAKKLFSSEELEELGEQIADAKENAGARA